MTHNTFLAAAYGLTAVCLVWEVISLRRRSRRAMSRMHEALESEE